MLQFFSKNFFPDYFSDRYFQKIDDERRDVNISIDGNTLQISLNTTVKPFISKPDTSNIIGGGSDKYTPELLDRILNPKINSNVDYKKKNTLNITVGKVTVDAVCFYEDEEELIELISILFEMFDDVVGLQETPKIQLNEIDDEEALLLIMENLL